MMSMQMDGVVWILLGIVCVLMRGRIARANQAIWGIPAPLGRRAMTIVGVGAGLVGLMFVTRVIS